MTKKQLIAQVAESASISAVAAEIAVESALSHIAHALHKGKDVKVAKGITIRSLVEGDV